MHIILFTIQLGYYRRHYETFETLNFSQGKNLGQNEKWYARVGVTYERNRINFNPPNLEAILVVSQRLISHGKERSQIQYNIYFIK